MQGSKYCHCIILDINYFADRLIYDIFYSKIGEAIMLLRELIVNNNASISDIVICRIRNLLQNCVSKRIILFGAGMGG